jgi:hypothetical protein
VESEGTRNQPTIFVKTWRISTGQTRRRRRQEIAGGSEKKYKGGRDEMELRLMYSSMEEELRPRRCKMRLEAKMRREDV